MMCMVPEETFAALEAKFAPAKVAAPGPKIRGNTWAAKQEAKLWAELAAKKRGQA